MFSDETRVPVIFYDVHGRPVIIDREERGHELYLASDDEGMVRIEGNSPGDS